ncbi:MAG: hypothetical protein AAB966_00035 [Patescibacteria group bacterium]
MKEQIERKIIGDWSSLIGPTIKLENSESFDNFIRGTFDKFQEAYKPEPGYEYFFYQNTGLPSPIIRIDMPLVLGSVEENQGIYEIETRPAGLGLDSMLFEEHRATFRRYIDLLQIILERPFAVKMLPYIQDSRHDPGGEKREFAQLMGIPFFDKDEEPDNIDDFLYFVYGNCSTVPTLQKYEERSLFPVRDDGNKNYLVQMGKASIADLVTVSRKMNLGASFVLKPRKGMWAQDVQMYPGALRTKYDGFALEKDIVRVIEDGKIENYLLQPFISPGLLDIDGKEYCAMARVYGLANMTTHSYDPVNGIYIARRNVRLHGTSDAITGELLL